MKLIKENITTLLLAVFVIAIATIIYAPMYGYQEGMQIFMSGWDFFAEMSLRPGGLSDYAGCFLVQFFMYPAYIALILAAVVCGVQLSSKKIFLQQCPAPWADFLSVVCALGVVATLVYLNTVFGGVVAILLALLAAAVCLRTQNIILLTIATPVVYWIAGGWCCAIYVVAVTINNRKPVITLAVNALALAFAVLITKKIMQDDSLWGTFVGVEYNRYDKVANYSWFVAGAIVVASLLLSKINLKINRLIVQIPMYAVAAGALVVWMAHIYDKGSMLDYKIDKMVRYKQWARIVNTVTETYEQSYKSQRYYTSYQTQCYFNIALNELGILDSKMFNVMQIGTEGLASAVIDNTDKSIYNSEIYFRLGLLNIAERLAVEAMESNDTHQKSARQYKRLAEINIIRGDKPLAMRYIRKLQRTMFYSAWADRAEQYINNPEQTEPLADWKIVPLEMQRDVFAAPATKSDFFLHMLFNNQHNKKVFNYYICELLLEKKIERIHDFLAQYRPDDELGTHIYEALVLYSYRFNQEEFKKIMSNANDLTKRFQQFINFMNSADAQNPQKAKKLFGKTYWFYFFYCN